jgi:thiol-disulfide isomerase/thioredoxin
MSDFGSLFSLAPTPRIRGGKKLRGGDGNGSSCDGGMIALIVVVIIILLIAIGMACCYGCYGGSSNDQKFLYYDKETGKLVAGARFRSGKARADVAAAKEQAKTKAQGAKAKAAGAKGKLQEKAAAYKAAHGGAAAASAPRITSLSSEEQLMQKLGSGKPVMVFIHMDNCGFCKRAMEQVYTPYLAMRHPYVELCDINMKHCQRFCGGQNIDGFPAFVSNFEDAGRLKVHMGFKSSEIMDQILAAARARGIRAVVSPTADEETAAPEQEQQRPRVAAAAGAVKDMTAADALALFKSKAPAVVAVVAPWCGFCKKLKEEKVFEKLKAAFPQITFGFVDGTAEANKEMVKALSEENGGRFGFPTVLHSFVPAGSGKMYETVSGYRPFEAFHQLVSEKMAARKA